MELGSWKISPGSAYQCIQSHVLLKDFRLNEALSRLHQAEAWPQPWMARCSHEFQTRAGSNTHLDLIKCKTCGVELLRCLHNKVNFCELEKCMGTREACRVIENPTAHGLKTSSQESSEPVRQTYTPTLGEKARARDKMRGQVPHNILTMQAFQNMTDSMSDTDADAFIQFLAEERQKARTEARDFMAEERQKMQVEMREFMETERRRIRAEERSVAAPPPSQPSPAHKISGATLPPPPMASSSAAAAVFQHPSDLGPPTKKQDISLSSSGGLKAKVRSEASGSADMPTPSGMPMAQQPRCCTQRWSRRPRRWEIFRRRHGRQPSPMGGWTLRRSRASQIPA